MNWPLCQISLCKHIIDSEHPSQSHPTYTTTVLHLSLPTTFRPLARVADVEGAQERRSTKGQGLLQKEGPPTYAILSQNLVLSRFTRFLKGFHKALNESHPAFNFQRKLSCFRRAFNESYPSIVELSTIAILLS